MRTQKTQASTPKLHIYTACRKLPRIATAQVTRSVHRAAGIEDAPSGTIITQMTNAALAANLARLKVTSLFPLQLEASRLLKPKNNMDLTIKVLNGMGKTYAAAIPIFSQLIEQKKDLEQGMPWEIPGTIPLTSEERYEFTRSKACN
jgi:ATP-dependent helicase YprA (DUF1998 family)